MWLLQTWEPFLRFSFYLLSPGTLRHRAADQIYTPTAHPRWSIVLTQQIPDKRCWTKVEPIEPNTRVTKAWAGVSLRKEDDSMACRLCTQLEEAVQSAHASDTPSRLLGLSEAAQRNRTRQRQELLLTSETNLEKHKKWCMKKAESSLADD